MGKPGREKLDGYKIFENKSSRFFFVLVVSGSHVPTQHGNPQ